MRREERVEMSDRTGENNINEFLPLSSLFLIENGFTVKNTHNANVAHVHQRHMSPPFSKHHPPDQT